MLSLASADWAKMKHAYGSAEDIPSLLRMLVQLPDDGGEDEPWFMLWSSLAHQGDVYPASFAAVPYVVSAFQSDPHGAPSVYLHFPAWVEICRLKAGIAVPAHLDEAYREALNALRKLAADVLGQDQIDEGKMRCALAAIAASHGNWELGEIQLELSPDVTAECLEWLIQR
jgi:hypothetical protein